uniref:S8 family serine peptidase n=1 Tax=Aquisphaera insulae TaxID=2712864 RepID=UPI0013EBD241
ATIQGGLAQRSFVDRLEWTFSESVNLQGLIADGSILRAVTLTNLGVNADSDADRVVTLTADQFRYDAATHKLTWSLDRFANGKTSLDDGYYRFQIDAHLVLDDAGNVLDGDGNGSAGGTYGLGFFRLLGDATGDGTVVKTGTDPASSDMALVNAALGTRPGYAKWNANADLDRDGYVGTLDRLIVANNGGHAIVPPATTATGTATTGGGVATAPAGRENAEAAGDLSDAYGAAYRATLAAAGTVVRTWSAGLTAVLDAAADVDWFRLDPAAGGTLRVAASLAGGTAGKAPWITVYEASAAGLQAEAGASGTAETTVVAGRRYYVKVEAGAGTISPARYLLDLGVSEFDAYLDMIGLDEVRADTDYRGTGYSIAVIDTGINYTLPAFAGRVILGPDFGDNDADPMDANGHGTHVAGLAAGANAYTPGVASGANLVALKITSGSSSTAGLGAIEQALQWVLDNRLRYNIVSINLSFGGGDVAKGTTVASLEPLYRALADAGVFIAAAAGNGYGPGVAEGLSILAASPSVASVGAVWDSSAGSASWSSGAKDLSTAADRVASFSQRGEGLDLLAPGANVLNMGLDGGLVVRNGTSMATPLVAAAAVLLREAADRLGLATTPAGLLALLRQTGVSVLDGDDESDNVSNSFRTYARLDVAAALEALKSSSSLPLPGVTSTAGRDGSTISGAGVSSAQLAFGPASTGKAAAAAVTSSTAPPGGPARWSWPADRLAAGALELARAARTTVPAFATAAKPAAPLVDPGAVGLAPGDSIDDLARELVAGPLRTRRKR